MTGSRTPIYKQGARSVADQYYLVRVDDNIQRQVISTTGVALCVSNFCLILPLQSRVNCNEAAEGETLHACNNKELQPHKQRKQWCKEQQRV